MNQGGSITHETTMMMLHKGHHEKAVFKICDLGKSNIIISFTWLKKHNPEINWKTGHIQFTRCHQECNIAIKEHKKKHAKAFKYKASIEEVNDDVKESEIEDEVDIETEEDIYLRVLEYIHTVDECVKVEKTGKNHLSGCLCINCGIMLLTLCQTLYRRNLKYFCFHQMNTKKC